MKLQIVTACDEKILKNTIESVQYSFEKLKKINTKLTILNPKIISNVSNYRYEKESHIMPAQHLINQQTYSPFMIYGLNKYIESDYILIIQHDSGILNIDSWTDDFLKYDYIGASWPILPHLVDFNNNQCEVGNGGFSLRSKRLHDALPNISYPYAFPFPSLDYWKEDVHICCKVKHILDKRGIKIAPVEIADKFSCESKKIDITPFGAHGTMFTELK